MPDPLLRLDQVVKIYTAGAGKVVALDRVSLSVAAGEFVTVTGPSGSGKSTLLHIAGCLDTPTSGTVYLGGVDSGTLEDDERARLRATELGFVFQQFNLLPRLSALENVGLPLVYAGVAHRLRRARAAAMLERVGLADQLTRSPAQLSGGEQQRVAIARALINEPRVLLADEPTGALDTRTGTELLELFQSINRTGTTVVVVTHEAAVAQAGQRQILVQDGRLVADQHLLRQPSVIDRASQ